MRQNPASTMQKTDWTIHSSSPSYVVLDVTTRGTITTIFLCIGPFLAWWPTNNRVILVQACSWPVWESSLLQYLILSTAVLVKKCHDAIMWSLWHLRPFEMWRWRSWIGGKKCVRRPPQVDAPREAPMHSRNTQCSGSSQHVFCRSICQS